MLLEIQQNGSGLEDCKVITSVVHDNRDAAIGIELDEPGLLLDVLGDVDGLDTEVDTV